MPFVISSLNYTPRMVDKMLTNEGINIKTKSSHERHIQILIPFQLNVMLLKSTRDLDD